MPQDSQYFEVCIVVKYDESVLMKVFATGTFILSTTLAQTTAPTASAVSKNHVIGDFTIEFLDAKRNGPIDFAEICAFCGAGSSGLFGGDRQGTCLVQFPQIGQISIADGTVPANAQVRISATTNRRRPARVSRDDWTWAIAALDQVTVPMPAADWKLVAVIAGTGAFGKISAIRDNLTAATRIWPFSRSVSAAAGKALP